jgi:hypothetical protein
MMRSAFSADDASLQYHRHAVAKFHAACKASGGGTRRDEAAQRCRQAQYAVTWPFTGGAGVALAHPVRASLVERLDAWAKSPVLHLQAHRAAIFPNPTGLLQSNKIRFGDKSFVPKPRSAVSPLRTS